AAARQRGNQLRIEAGRLGGLRGDERAAALRRPLGVRDTAADTESAEREAGGRQKIAAGGGPCHGGLLVQLLGARMSRSPSPVRLNASSVSMIARRGNYGIHGAVCGH